MPMLFCEGTFLIVVMSMPACHELDCRPAFRFIIKNISFCLVLLVCIYIARTVTMHENTCRVKVQVGSSIHRALLLNGSLEDYGC